MDMELLAVGGIILVAVVYVVRRMRSKGSCGCGCGGSKPPGLENASNCEGCGCIPKK